MTEGGGIIPRGDFFSLPGGFVASYVWASHVISGIILDTGCGYGYGADFLAESTANYVVGIDNDPSAIKFSHNNYTRQNLDFVLIDLTQIAIRKEKCDAVVSFEVFEHLTYTYRYLKEVANVLRIGGHFLLSTPNRCYTERFYVDGRSSNYYHIREYYPKEMERILSNFFEIRGIYRVFHPDDLLPDVDRSVRRRHSLEIKIPIKIRKLAPEPLKRLWQRCIGGSNGKYYGRYDEFRIERVTTIDQISCEFPTQIYDCVPFQRT